MAKKKSGNSNIGNTAEIVRKLALPVVEETGVFLWDVRFAKEGADWFLRVYIDKETAPVSINDCVAVSRKLSDLLDKADPISQSYCLEVSSPGIERELIRPEHFEMFAGAAVVVKLYHAKENGEREFAGILQDPTDDGIIRIVDIDGNTLDFDRKEVSSVHVLDDEDSYLSEEE